MKKAATVIVITLIAAMVLVLMFGERNTPIRQKPEVTVSTFALYDVSRYLLRGIADVTMLVPFGKNISSFKPTPQDVTRVQNSRLFLYNGAGLEPWAERFESSNFSLDMSHFVSLRELEKERYDPHYWLDIENMVTITKELSEIFRSTFDEVHSKEILKRSMSYVKTLRSIDELYTKRLANCRGDTIIVGHNAFGYLADRYNFHVVALNGLYSDSISEAENVAKLTELVHQKEIMTLFSEPFESAYLIQRVADESGTRVETLQPLANISSREERELHDYKLMMQLNLKKLYSALEC